MNVARPDPNYREACEYIVHMIHTLQRICNLLNDLRCMYDCERAQGQGPRAACPTSPDEDDPA